MPLDCASRVYAQMVPQVTTARVTDITQLNKRELIYIAYDT